VAGGDGTGARGYPDADAFVTPARRRLAQAARTLSRAVLTADSATDDQLDDAASATEQVVASLERAAPDAARVGRPDERRHGDYLPRSSLLGTVNPLAPPFTCTFNGTHVLAEGTFGVAYEGPPGYVHGGWVALAFDEVLGAANVASGHPGMTGRLTVRYRRPTPLHTHVTLDAHTVGANGRRITTVAKLTADGVVTAEAEGLFVTIGEEQALEYFGDRVPPDEPADPLP
jgi:hypothetical protein